MTLAHSQDLPSRGDALVFELKASAFRLRRLVRDAVSGPKRLPRADARDFPAVVARAQAPLWSEARPKERALQRGKVQNLRVAARHLDGTLLAPGAVFSFWKQLGRASRLRGFARGRMLKEGCIVPATGGGLCQLSNALYDVALKAGLAIVERHAHSRKVPGASGRDATVAWNYVDLRFKSAVPLLLSVRLTADELIVELLGRESQSEHAFAPQPDLRPQAQSCETCDETACFRHGVAASDGKHAVLVDELWPELDGFVSGDLLCAPMQRYGWSTRKFARAKTAPLTTLWRAFQMRRTPQGPKRRALELATAERLARRYAAMLDADVTALTVAQTLLPALWRDGHLGGRRFSVLMQRLPMTEIQARLDDAARRHPERGSLADFRADAAAEAEALAAAERIVTPHAGIAALFGDRAVLLDWAVPQQRFKHAPGSRRIAFPGPTIARKGAYELRNAARALDLEIVLLGSDLEGADFWTGVRTSRDIAQGVAAFVQPALLEDKPRKLLAALASGIPVIATRACGIAPRAGLSLVEDEDALTAALRAL
ncbi:MAG TPA: VanW family protein [Rhizomicrobium sp.]|nr:VanW family protein [Rhizomicrobium sp.]